MRKLVISYFFLLLVQNVFSQKITVYIIDEETRNEVQYAVIKFTKNNQSFSSGGGGEFVLNLSHININDTVIVSAIGYIPLKFSLNKLVENQQVLLKPHLIVLSEVVVMNADEIIRRVSENLKDNLADHPFESEGYYRESIQTDEKYVGYSDSKINYYSEGFNINRKKEEYKYLNFDNIQPIESRRSNYYLFHNKYGKPRIILFKTMLDIQHSFLYQNFFTEKIFKNMKFSYLTSEFHENEEVWVIGFEPIELSKKNIEANPYIAYVGKLYVNSKDYGLLRVEMEKKSTDETIIKNKATNYAMRQRYTKRILQYLPVNGKYYLSYFSFINCYDDFGWSKDNSPKKIKEFAELFLNELKIKPGNSHIDDAEKRKAKNLEPTSAGRVLYKTGDSFVFNYQSGFWRNYVVPPNPDFNKIVMDLSFELSLEEQFARNRGKKGLVSEKDKELIQNKYSKRLIKRKQRKN